MGTETEDGWVLDDQDPSKRSNRSKRGVPSGQGQSSFMQNTFQQLNFDPQDLTTIPGVTKLDRTNTPADLVNHTRSRTFSVARYYQVDNTPSWKQWKELLSRSGGDEKWLFYACPLSMTADLFTRNELLPYGEFPPRVFGRDAIYLFEHAGEAAQAAFKFGMETEGLLVSCRLATGRVFRTKQANPLAANLPQGYDVIFAPKGANLGGWPLRSDLYALFDPHRVLIRYITHIKSS